MKVAKAWFYNQKFENIETVTLSPEKKKFLSEMISRNSTAFINKSGMKKEYIGNRTECALLDMVDIWGYDGKKLKNLDHQLYQFAFNSNSKRMTTIYETDFDGLMIYSKGTAEGILHQCEYYLNSLGEKTILSFEKRDEIKQEINKYSSDSLRIIGLAYNICNMQAINEPNISQEIAEKNLIYIGFVGIQDPLRPEARNSVIKVQKAGITVRMVTGDKLETAINIAKQSNILPDSLTSEEIREYVMKGKYFRERAGPLVTIKDENGIITGFKVGNIEEFKEIIKKLRVIARCLPQDKLLLVVGLKELGEVVAVTGDGSNDAAALKQSDIGLAMMSGTQLAKESSDIILLDDNFESVFSTVKWGRNIYASTRKFFLFQMTVNFVAITVSIIGGIFVSSSPLSAVQMLWVNLIMDSFAALTFATEKPSNDNIENKPYGRTENIITVDMMIFMISQSVFQTIILLFIFFYGPIIFNIQPSWDKGNWHIDNRAHSTIFFHVFVMLQIFNEISCRELLLSEINIFKGFFNNWMFIFIFSGTFAIQTLLVQIGGEPFGCSPLPIEYHLIAIAIGISCLLYGTIIRVIITSYRNRKLKKGYHREDFEREIDNDNEFRLLLKN